MAAPLVIWDEQMLGYDLGGRHPMHPDRWVLTWALAESLGVLDGVERFAPPPADDGTLQLVHSPRYLEAVKRASVEPPAPPVGHGIGSTDTPAFPGMHTSSALIAGGSVAAAQAIARHDVDRAVNIAGGLHHAMPDAASGFCVYNDAALAIATLLAEGVERVAYIDVDVHHGDGVQAAFYDDPRVLTISIHETPQALWPGTGWASELGRGAAAGTAVNIGVPAGTTDAAWHRAFHAVVPSVVTAFRPQVLVTQHGADSHREDPLADLNLTVDGHRESYRALRELAERAAGGRWLALGGGGYSVVRVVPRSWTNLLATVLDRDIDPRTGIGAGWLARAAELRPHIEAPTTMTEGAPDGIVFEPWDGMPELPVDRVIDDVRRAVFPLHGLDPFDPRD
ncbi:acetoin utilization protein AcuC [Nakamurella lactea]|uniref:acetoin utilization protein AcuC n=1 Tax=Nakamurella lactea TaxID=459515 RepID=UPI000406C344|nr:acetoin utilization protein AcuC [Nakamurella lactea]